MSTTIAYSYNHTQTTPAATWNMPHHLNRTTVIVDVYILTDAATNAYRKAIPADVVMVDNNNAQIIFNNPQTGYARVI